MKIPFYVYLIVGAAAGAVSVMFLPRWNALDHYYFGLGLVAPQAILFIILSVFFWLLDKHKWTYKLLYLLLLLLADVGVMAWIISSIKLRF